jgi:hypothetical protein
MVYIHDAEDELKHRISPLEILARHTINKQPTAKQTIMITDGAQPETTALTIPGQEEPIEHVEAQADLTNQLFPPIPSLDKSEYPRPLLSDINLNDMNEAFKLYYETFPLDARTGRLTQLIRRIKSRIKTDKPIHAIINS